MAALTSLRVSVTRATPIEDQSTYQYHIKLQYGASTWEVAKRFSEFDTLLQSLSAGRYAGLPRLPAKTLLGSPTDDVAIAGRKEQLRIILHDLLCRPDTRTSQQVRQFLALDSHTEAAVRSLQPEALRTFEDPRFGVSGLCAAPQANLLMVTHEDSTHLSRLGRVWSVVEPDELGALHVWAQASDGAWKRMYSNTYGIKVRSLAWEETSRQLFVGLEDGKIEVYEVPADTLQPTQQASLELHHKSPVTHLSVSPRRLLSLGFDTAVRVIDVRSRDLVCGGRLMKRLRNESDYLTCGFLDDERERAFIGTSGGDMFILDVSRNPPNFLHTFDLNTKPVSMMCLYKENLLVAHADCVSVLSFEEKGKEQRTARLGSHRCKQLLADETTILSVACAPERGLIFGGYGDGSVAMWTSREAEAFVVIRAHQCDVTTLVWVPGPPWGPSLFTGGGDGKVTTWRLAGGDEDFAFWSPLGVSTGNDPFQGIGGGPLGPTVIGASEATLGGTSDTLAAFEPTFGVSSDAFRVDNPRVNPQALKGADETDSEDDIVDAFR